MQAPIAHDTIRPRNRKNSARGLTSVAHSSGVTSDHRVGPAQPRRRARSPQRRRARTRTHERTRTRSRRRPAGAEDEAEHDERGGGHDRKGHHPGESVEQHHRHRPFAKATSGSGSGMAATGQREQKTYPSRTLARIGRKHRGQRTAWVQPFDRLSRPTFGSRVGSNAGGRVFQYPTPKQGWS